MMRLLIFLRLGQYLFQRKLRKNLLERDDIRIQPIKLLRNPGDFCVVLGGRVGGLVLIEFGARKCQAAHIESRKADFLLHNVLQISD